MQIYVDDPAGIVHGKTADQRTHLMLIYLMFVRALGFEVSWKKLQRGRQIDWIGAQFELESNTNGLMVTLSREKAALLQKSLASLLHAGMVSSKRALTIAGLSSWAASVVPRARPFVSHLWGAIKDAKHDAGTTRPSTRTRPKDLIFVRRFRHSACWLSELLKDDNALARRFSVE